MKPKQYPTSDKAIRRSYRKLNLAPCLPNPCDCHETQKEQVWKSILKVHGRRSEYQYLTNQYYLLRVRKAVQNAPVKKCRSRQKANHSLKMLFGTKRHTWHEYNDTDVLIFKAMQRLHGTGLPHWHWGLFRVFDFCIKTSLLTQFSVPSFSVTCQLPVYGMWAL